MSIPANLAGPLRHAFQKRWWLQAGFFVLVSWVGGLLVQRLGIGLPGTILGMGLVLALLASRLMRPESLRRGALVLQDHLMLFFVPPMLALLDHPEFLSLDGLLVLLSVVVGTLAVMAGTGLVVEFCIRAIERAEAREGALRDGPHVA
jgi:holin-like protein